MSREERLTAAEIRYKPHLEDFFIKTWGPAILYSHDISHHRRVWKYAGELYLTTGPDDLPAEKLLITSYLHDIGMATDRSERHGSVSMELCRSFLAANNMDTDHYSDVLGAIESHDDKEYRKPASNHAPLLKILSAADDLDAFGYTGVYRYLEIYLARGIDPAIIGHEIIRNATVRFLNFESGFANYPSLIEKYKPRYLILANLMARHNSETEMSVSKKGTGNLPQGIVSLVSDMMRYNLPPGETETLSLKYADNKMVTEFVKGLTHELSE
ncbi:MAG TPA: HD domain-containing protein [Bacteroidales bacterium]|jgi:hypothetical protein|nr:HD domain-containing protein [Bacteroidales bacterium]